MADHSKICHQNPFELPELSLTMIFEVIKVLCPELAMSLKRM
jgi:hypothetical protein